MLLQFVRPRRGADDLLTVVEVQSYLQVSRATVQRWCRSGELPAVKLGKEYRIRRRVLDAWFEGKRLAHVDALGPMVVW